MKHLVGKLITKKVPFMGDEVEIRKLSVKEVLEVQEIVKKASKDKSEKSQLKLVQDVLKIAVTGANELSDEEFNGFPLGELSAVSEEILAYSGIGGEGVPPKGN